MANTSLPRTVLVPRLILTAMLLGIVTLGVVAVVWVHTGRATLQPQLGRLLFPALALAAVPVVVAYLLLRGGVLGRLRHEAAHTPERVTVEVVGVRLLPVTIVGGALAEGLSLFGVVVYLLTGHVPALAAPAAGIVALLFLMPSAARIGRLTSMLTGRVWEG